MLGINLESTPLVSVALAGATWRHDHRVVLAVTALFAAGFASARRRRVLPPGQRVAWKGLEPTGRSMRIDEVYFFRFPDDLITGMWGLEDTWTRMRQLAGDNATLGELGSLS